MQVSVGVFGHVVVEDDVDSLDVHSSSEQVGGNQNTALEVLLKILFSDKKIKNSYFFRQKKPLKMVDIPGRFKKVKYYFVF